MICGRMVEKIMNERIDSVQYLLNVTIAITITKMPNLMALCCDLCDSNDVIFNDSSLNSTLDTSLYSWNSDFRTEFLASIIL